MNVQEFQEFEQHPELSVLSRLIYIFGLKRCAMESQSTTVFLNYEQIKNRVSVQQESGSIKRPQSLQIEQALYELGVTRLLQIPEQQFVDGAKIYLPLMDAMLSKVNLMGFFRNQEGNWQEIILSRDSNNHCILRCLYIHRPGTVGI